MNKAAAPMTLDERARTTAPGVLDLAGLDELSGEWLGWACSLAVTLGYAAYCAWQLRGCFRQALDVARGWRLTAGAANAAAAVATIALQGATNGAERSQEPQGPAAGDSPA